MADYTVLSPQTCTISARARIGAGAVIYPNNHILGGSVIGEKAVLYPGNIVEDSFVGGGAHLTASVLRGARVGAGCEVGPFSHLRQGAELGENCRVGSFAEVKNASLGAGCRAAHLAYIGDADLGEGCNVGCGAVFCNFDGKAKHRTRVGKNCFIGANVNLVAPVMVGEGSFIAAATTVTADVPAGSFVIGRARQSVKTKEGDEA